MAHDRASARVMADSVFQLTIGAGQAVVLPHVFLPGVHDECLDVSIGNFEVPGNSPTRRTIAAPDAPVFAQGIEEVRFVAGGDVVLDGNQDGAARIGRNGGKAPVVPWCQIRPDIGDA